MYTLAYKINVVLITDFGYYLYILTLRGGKLRASFLLTRHAPNSLTPNIRICDRFTSNLLSNSFGKTGDQSFGILQHLLPYVAFFCSSNTYCDMIFLVVNKQKVATIND